MQDQLLGIERKAFGTLPNGPPGPKVSDDGLTNLKLIALNEPYIDTFISIHRILELRLQPACPYPRSYTLLHCASLSLYPQDFGSSSYADSRFRWIGSLGQVNQNTE